MATPLTCSTSGVTAELADERRVDRRRDIVYRSDLHFLSEGKDRLLFRICAGIDRETKYSLGMSNTKACFDVCVQAFMRHPNALEGDGVAVAMTPRHMTPQPRFCL